MDDMSQEETYLKRQLVSFFDSMGYINDVMTSNAIAAIQKKWCIETCLLVDVGPKEVHQIIFGK